MKTAASPCVVGEPSPQEVPQVRCVLRIRSVRLFAFRPRTWPFLSAILTSLSAPRAAACPCPWLPLTAADTMGPGECALPSSPPFCLTYEPGGIHFWGLLVIKYQRLGSSHNILYFPTVLSLEVQDQTQSWFFLEVFLSLWICGCLVFLCLLHSISSLSPWFPSGYVRFIFLFL